MMVKTSLKKIVAAFLILPVLVFSGEMEVYAATFDDVNFHDVKKTDWFYDAVYYGVTKGFYIDEARFHDGYFRPDHNLNRAEMVKLIVEAWDLHPRGGQKPVPGACKDVNFLEWYGSYFHTLVENKIMEGYKDSKGNLTGNCGPADPLTREQAAKMLVLAAKLPQNSQGGPHFFDVPKASWSYVFIESLHAKILLGYSDGSYRPQNKINRAEVVTIIYRLLQKSDSDTTPDTPPDQGPTEPTPPSPTPTPSPIPPPITDPTPPSDSQLTGVINAFKTLRNQSLFPVQGKSIEDVESTFGPRILGSNYDWHRGIDLPASQGTPVLAVLDGTLEKIDKTSSGGNIVILKHTFPQPVTFHNKQLTNYYTYYSHLDTINSKLTDAYENDIEIAVQREEQIGTVGDTGAEEGHYHLHFEIRVGTQCSLEAQLENPDSTCSKGFMFDPHVHPLYLFPPLAANLKLETTTTPVKTADTTVTFTSPQNQPLLNRIEYRLTNSQTGQIAASHVLDLNLRSGFDASSTSSLDTQDKTKPYLQPIKFGDSSTIYSANIIIPQIFINNLSGDKSVLTVTDIWGNSKTLEWSW